MKVQLIQWTPNAKELLIFTKNTRLLSNLKSYAKIFHMPDDEKELQLKYIFGTILNPLEFVNYVFLMRNVSRIFTHQLVRTRVGVSFAQQSTRVTNQANFTCEIPDSIANNRDALKVWSQIIEIIKWGYEEFINLNIPFEDARKILPLGINTNILMKINLSALSTMASKRLCNRTEKEYREVIKKIIKKVLSIHPWAKPVLQCYCDIHKECFYKNGKGCGRWPETKKE